MIRMKEFTMIIKTTDGELAKVDGVGCNITDKLIEIIAKDGCIVRFVLDNVIFFSVKLKGEGDADADCD